MKIKGTKIKIKGIKMLNTLGIAPRGVKLSIGQKEKKKILSKCINCSKKGKIVKRFP